MIINHKYLSPKQDTDIDRSCECHKPAIQKASKSNCHAIKESFDGGCGTSTESGKETSSRSPLPQKTTTWVVLISFGTVLQSALRAHACVSLHDNLNVEKHLVQPSNCHIFCGAKKSPKSIKKTTANIASLAWQSSLAPFPAPFQSHQRFCRLDVFFVGSLPTVRKDKTTGIFLPLASRWSIWGLQIPAVRCMWP